MREHSAPWKVTPRINIESRSRADLSTRERTLQQVPEEGILKRSSAFLANLTHHPSTKLADCASSSSKHSGLKGYFSILTNGEDAHPQRLQQSSSVQTLSSSWKKKDVSVKKSVSFSSDTSFEEKRTPYRKSAVHEAKIYRKGVLQGEFCVRTFDRDKFMSLLAGYSDEKPGSSLE